MRAFLAALVAAASLVIVSAPAEAASPATRGCYGVHGRLVCNGASVRRPTHPFVCVYVNRQMLEVFGWQAIGEGAIFSGAGLLADGTIAGLPAGVVLGLIGIGSGAGGSFIVWYADGYFQPGWKCGYV